jgi:Protein of unknown function (DUF3306)
MSDSFLERWSRRKREARRAEPPPEPAGDEEGRALVAPAAAPSDPAVDEEPALTPEEIARLPSLEELTAETDISCFLRKGVPETLRNAALRRMWSLDPAIRDFVGEARDYSYDWNTPGGVPGGGELAPGEHVQAMLRQIFGEAEPESSRVREGELPAEPATESPAASQQAEPAEAPTGAACPGADSEKVKVDRILSPDNADAAPAALQQEKPPTGLHAAAERRHGGAKPV